MTQGTQRLVAIEGVDGAALVKAARSLAEATKDERPHVSSWDASGLFGEVAVADVGSGTPSPRTLILLYAADVAFRVRQDVRPALAAGRLVIVSPWIETAMAFGRAAGIDEAWLASIFSFAPRPCSIQVAGTTSAREGHHRQGFVEFACRQTLGDRPVERARLVRRTAAFLSERRPDDGLVPGP